MSVRRAIALSRKAQTDYSEILLYTKREWGIAQRDRYKALLASGFGRIADFPELGEPRSEIAIGVRSIRVEMHIVYYRVTPKTIRILRVRHIHAAIPEPKDL